jgi:hypothetical protein
MFWGRVATETQTYIREVLARQRERPRLSYELAATRLCGGRLLGAGDLTHVDQHTADLGSGRGQLVRRYDMNPGPDQVNSARAGTEGQRQAVRLLPLRRSRARVLLLLRTVLPTTGCDGRLGQGRRFVQSAAPVMGIMAAVAADLGTGINVVTVFTNSVGRVPRPQA